jgi:hypothetical protein
MFIMNPSFIQKKQQIINDIIRIEKIQKNTKNIYDNTCTNLHYVNTNIIIKCYSLNIDYQHNQTQLTELHNELDYYNKN